MITGIFALAAVVVWLGSGAWLAVTDYRTRRLPTQVIWSTAAAVWVLYSVASIIEGRPDGLVGAVLGAVSCGAFLAAVHFIHPPSMGFGDVRLSVLNGMLCGWWGWDVAVMGLAAGFAVALPEAVLTLVRHGMRASRPLGHYLIIGVLIIVIWASIEKGLVPFG